MSADLRLKTTQENGDIQIVEIFIRKAGFVLHRHCFIDNLAKAKAYGNYRKFWDKFYTTQVIVITKREVDAIICAFSTSEILQQKIKDQSKPEEK